MIISTAPVIAWWLIPTLITVAGLAWSFLWVLPREDGYFVGLGCVMSLIPVLGVSAIAWAIAGFFK